MKRSLTILAAAVVLASVPALANSSSFGVTVNFGLPPIIFAVRISSKSNSLSASSKARSDSICFLGEEDDVVSQRGLEW